MFDFLSFSSWRPSSKTGGRQDNDVDDELNLSLPWPVTQHSSKSRRNLPLDASSISAPIPRSSTTSLTGFDNYPPGGSSELWQFRQPSTSSLSGSASGSRVGLPLMPPSNISWLSSNPAHANQAQQQQHSHLQHSQPVQPQAEFGFPATSASGDTSGSLPSVIRMETTPVPKSGMHTIRRTVSSPPTSSYYPSPTSSSPNSSSEMTPISSAFSNNPRWNLKLHTEHLFSQSTHSLRLDSSLRPSPFYTPGTSAVVGQGFGGLNADVFGNAYNYPLAKQLSPIVEQDYFSPDSLKRTKTLPSTNSSRSVLNKDLRLSASAASGSMSLTNNSPSGSQGSEIARPSPVYPSPFITRQLNRTASQTSSRTHVSATSSIPRMSAKSNEAPVIPPLDLRPPFPGPHPGPTGSGPNLRPRRSTIATMPIIHGSTEGDNMDDEYAGTTESLHAESFVTATSDDHIERARRQNSVREIEIVDKESFGNGSRIELASVHSAGSKMPSVSESFITRRWDRDIALGSGVPTFRAKRQWITVTPAFWTFWLGFICPVLWLVGGWHFTNFGEQPPRLTFWEFYFNAGYWKETCCGGRNKKKELSDTSKRAGKKVEPPPLPRWVAEKQMSDDGRARLNDPKRSLKGISFGYPFIPRSVPVHRDETLSMRMVKRIVEILGKPNRIYDHLYGVKLREVRGRPESGRRVFDPWIQRSRYALCHAMLLLALGLLSASTYLIVYNTRQLH